MLSEQRRRISIWKRVSVEKFPDLYNVFSEKVLIAENPFT